MALLIGDNFSYNGKKPNFERDSFETLAILKAFSEANIDNGHIAYCKETNKHYIFNDSNSDDPLTGKWRELESEFSNLIDSSDLEAYLTKNEAQSTYQPIGDYALKSEIPSLDGYATEVWVNSQGFLRSIPEEYVTESELDAKDYATKDEIPDISNLALKSEIPTKVSQLENDSNYLTSVPDNYVTDTELQEAISGVQFELPIASDTVLGGIKIGAGLAINPDTGVLSTTGGGTADAVDWTNVTSKPQLNGHDLVSGNNTLDSLGIQPAGNYALKSEIPSLNGYATESWVSSQGYLTSIPNNYVTDDELTEAINDAKYTLPIASTDTLGGIKIGAGLSITEDGILSATGGGVADSVNWENVIGRPTSLSQFTNDSGFITNDDLPDLTDYALKSEIPTVPTNISSFTNDAGYITNSALTDYAKKSEIPDISNLATKSELSNYAPTEHTHVVADITDFPEIPDVSNLATKAEVNAKQDTLVSGTNIKTINGTSLLGSGNIVIEAGGGSEIMDVLDDKSYARTQGSWVDLTDWLTWAEYN